MATKTYNSVSEMVHDISDPASARAFDRHQTERRIIRQLTIQRVVKGLSQRDLAALLQCTQSRISKLESSTDAELSIDELRTYATAVGMELAVSLIAPSSSPGASSNARKIKSNRKRASVAVKS